MLRFEDVCPEEARRQVTCVRIGDDEDSSLPPGVYELSESFCADPVCDCRRALITISHQGRGPVATVSFGFDAASLPPWAEDDDNPFLDPFNPQSEHSPALLEAFEFLVSSPDCDYRELLEERYWSFKEAIGARFSRGSSRAGFSQLRWPGGDASPFASFDAGIVPTAKDREKRKRERRQARSSRRRNRKG